MKEQNYANHSRYVPGFHFLTSTLAFALLIIGVITLFKNPDIMLGAFEVITAIVAILLFIYTRQFAVKVQDRAIRTEENLRHFSMTGKTMDGQLTISQVIALRFASDDEFVALANRALKENLTADQIKKAISKWRVDHHRA